MKFQKADKSNKTELDLSGNLVLSKNDHLLAAPSKARSRFLTGDVVKARYIMIKHIGFFGKIAASLIAVHYIWSSKK